MISGRQETVQQVRVLRRSTDTVTVTAVRLIAGILPASNRSTRHSVGASPLNDSSVRDRVTSLTSMQSLAGR